MAKKKRRKKLSPQQKAANTRRRNFLRRRRAAKKGWITRRRHEREARIAERELEETIEDLEKAFAQRVEATWIVTIHIHSIDKEGKKMRERECDFIVQAPFLATNIEVLRRCLKPGVQLRWVLGQPATNDTPQKTFRWMMALPSKGPVSDAKLTKTSIYRMVMIARKQGT